MLSTGGASGEVAAGFHGYRPLAVLDDVINAFNDYVYDAADSVEHALKQEPALQAKHREIEQGVDRWQLMLQRMGDKHFDAFEAKALSQIFSVPDDLQQDVVPESSEDADADDAEIQQLWAELQRAVAVKRELQRRVAGVQKQHLAWQAQESCLEQLMATHKPEVVQGMLDTAQQLQEKLRANEQTNEPRGKLTLLAPGRGLAGQQPMVPQLLSQHRRTINTVSVPDLQQLSSKLVV